MKKKLLEKASNTLESPNNIRFFFSPPSSIFFFVYYLSSRFSFSSAVTATFSNLQMVVYYKHSFLYCIYKIQPQYNIRPEGGTVCSLPKQTKLYSICIAEVQLCVVIEIYKAMFLIRGDCIDGKRCTCRLKSEITFKLIQRNL